MTRTATASKCGLTLMVALDFMRPVRSCWPGWLGSVAAGRPSRGPLPILVTVITPPWVASSLPRPPQPAHALPRAGRDPVSPLNPPRVTLPPTTLVCAAGQPGLRRVGRDMRLPAAGCSQLK